MNMTRELYWNVGQSVVLPMYILVLAAFAFMCWLWWRRLHFYRQGKALNRFDRKGERIKRMLRESIGQIRVRRVQDSGLPHAVFLWSFFALFIGTLLVMLQTDLVAPLFDKNILSGPFYLFFSLALDIAGLLAIVMLLRLFYRRFVERPEGLETNPEDIWMYGLLFAVLITGFLVEGARIAATELTANPVLARFSPVGLFLAKLMEGMSTDTLSSIHKVFWWVHLVTVLGFFVVLPLTKLKHIVLLMANSFFAPLEEKGNLALIDMEDEEAEQFGAAKVSDMTWKDLFDTDACVKCMRCQDRCPAHQTDKPLSPMDLISQLGGVAGNGAETELVPAFGTDVLWSCTTCGACQDICPANIEHVNKIIEVRRNLSLMEGDFPGDEVRTAIGHMEVNSNPFGMAFAGRGDWADGLGLVDLSDGENADILYFAGCYASFDKRNQAVARNFVKICNAAGVSVGILGKEEKCCGEPVRKLGNEYLYQMLAVENIEMIKASGVNKIVTTCPHCFNTLSRDYRDMGLDISTEHYATFIHSLIGSGRLSLSEGTGDICTYHDSCYLGRYKDVTEQPRAILGHMGWKVAEMEKSGYDSFCCGAGGGRILAEEKLGNRINVDRVEQAGSTGAPLMVSSCPFCLTMFEDGIKGSSYEDKLKVRDLTELIAERIGEKL